MPRDSSEVFKRMMEARFVEFSESMEKMIRAFGTGADQAQRKALATELASRLQAMFDNLAPNDRPQWLIALWETSRSFRDEPSAENGFRLLKAIANNQSTIKRINLTEGNDYEFDKVYERLRDAENVPELFDRLVAEISAIIESGLVEEIAAQKALEEVIAALKANRKSSWWATMYTSKYARWAWLVAVGSLKRVPGLKEAIEATEKIMKEEEDALERVRKGMEVEAYKAIAELAPQIKRLAEAMPNVPRIEGTRSNIENVQDAEFEVRIGVENQPAAS